MSHNIRTHIDAAMDALLPAAVAGILGAPGWAAGGLYATLFIVFLRQNRGPQK